jgi:hypothetical protein
LLRWSVERFRLWYTVENVCDLFGCAPNLAEIFPIETIFCTFE